MTTRAQRPGEVDGVDYFRPRAEFENWSVGQMLEYAEYVSLLRGTPPRLMSMKPATKGDVFLEISSGGSQVRKKSSDIFILRHHQVEYRSSRWSWIYQIAQVIVPASKKLKKKLLWCVSILYVPWPCSYSCCRTCQTMWLKANLRVDRGIGHYGYATKYSDIHSV